MNTKQDNLLKFQTFDLKIDIIDNIGDFITYALAVGFEIQMYSKSDGYWIRGERLRELTDDTHPIEQTHG